MQPHTLGVPPPPHVCGRRTGPQVTVPPHPSGSVPQLSPAGHDVGVQPHDWRSRRRRTSAALCTQGRSTRAAAAVGDGPAVVAGRRARLRRCTRRRWPFRRRRTSAGRVQAAPQFTVPPHPSGEVAAVVAERGARRRRAHTKSTCRPRCSRSDFSCSSRDATCRRAVLAHCSRRRAHCRFVASAHAVRQAPVAPRRASPSSTHVHARQPAGVVGTGRVAHRRGARTRDARVLHGAPLGSARSKCVPPTLIGCW